MSFLSSRERSRCACRPTPAAIWNTCRAGVTHLLIGVRLLVNRRKASSRCWHLLTPKPLLEKEACMACLVVKGSRQALTICSVPEELEAVLVCQLCGHTQLAPLDQ